MEPRVSFVPSLVRSALMSLTWSVLLKHSRSPAGQLCLQPENVSAITKLSSAIFIAPPYSRSTALASAQVSAQDPGRLISIGIPGNETPCARSVSSR